MFSFGSGVLQGVRTDVANATPINFGLVQEVTTDLQFNVKELYGQFQFPIAVARGTAKFTAKAKVARISPIAIGTLFFGIMPTTGQIATAFGEAGVIPTTPYQLTAANGATFVDDLGVVFSATGLPLTKVASAPSTGQYSVTNVGVYTFAAADTTKGVLLNYTYTIAATGFKIPITNQLIGTTPTFKCNLFTTFGGQQLTANFPNCTSNKFAFGTKIEDFVIPEFDFHIFADAAGNVGTFGFGEQA